MSDGNDNQVERANQRVMREVVLPNFSKDLGEEFKVTVRKLTGKNYELLTSMPTTMGKTELSMEDNLKQLPWLKRVICASVIKPRVVEKSIGDHGPNELSVDAIENDLDTILMEVLKLTNLVPEGGPGESFRTATADTPAA